jgi:catechol 2,3-dioxygenase
VQVEELGHVVLYVRDIERSRRFYRDVLGFPEIDAAAVGFPAAAFTTGRTHHELLLIEVGPDAAELPTGRRVGMYHFGLKIGETDDDLRQAWRELKEAGAEVLGAADHTVTHSLYIRDPDGHEIELYIDVPGADWRADPSLVMNPTKPLAL